jgi:hypothetical protein
MKRIQALDLLGRYNTQADSFSGILFFTGSWADWILVDIQKNRIFLMVRKGIPGAGQRSKVNFKKSSYLKLTEVQQGRVEQVFKDNIGRAVAEILNMRIDV